MWPSIYCQLSQFLPVCLQPTINCIHDDDKNTIFELAIFFCLYLGMCKEVIACEDLKNQPTNQPTKHSTDKQVLSKACVKA